MSSPFRLAILAALVSGCAPLTSGSPPVSEASKGTTVPVGLPADCANASAWQEELRSLRPDAIVGLRPKHIVDTCSGTSQASGTTLILRPGDTSHPWTRMLRCSSARVFFGGAGESWIPDGWVDLEVRPAGGGASLTISAESVSKNIQLLRRATAFAHAR